MSLKYPLILVTTIILLYSSNVGAKNSPSSEGSHGQGFRMPNPFSYFGSSESSPAKIFKSSKLIPDILNCPPKQYLRIKYGNQEILPGSSVGMNQDVTAAPEVTWLSKIKRPFQKFLPQNLHTLIMLDPDALCPTRYDWRNVLQWLVGNIKGEDITTGDTPAPYNPPGPMNSTGIHRYVLLVYSQPGNKPITFPEYPDPPSRVQFDLTKFLDTYGLSKSLQAGSFFLMENTQESVFEDPCDPGNLTG